jgi:hypothetical protein
VRDDVGRPRSEMDVLKFFIWLMVVMTLAVAGFYWKMSSDVDEVQRNLKQGNSWMPEFAKEGAEIQAMMNVHKTNKEDAARDQPFSWFAGIWRKRGIPNDSMVPQAWTVPPKSESKGAMRYFEERIDMGFNNKAPLSRQQIVEFCHEVEKSSTRLRVLELDLRRADKDNFDKDLWSGKATIGYRHPRID